MPSIWQIWIDEFMFLSNLENILIRECGLLKNTGILVGVSGGPDSLCLLEVLVQAGFLPYVAHFDHQLRESSGEEAAVVQQAAVDRGLPFILGSRDVRAYASKEKLSLEEAARKARYHFLFDQARQNRCQAVAVAHNADDQVETVLMHLLRGSGISGLKGMAYRSLLPEWDAGIPLVRPLLASWRTEIENYCRVNSLSPVYDASNSDIAFFRNRLRHDLIPELTLYNPQVKQVFWNMSQAMAGDLAILEDIKEQSWQGCFLQQTATHVTLSLGNVRGMKRGLQRSLLRKAAACLRPKLRDFDFKAIERGIVFLLEPNRTGQIDLVDGLVLYTQGDELFVAEQNAEINAGQWPGVGIGDEYELIIPGLIEFRNGWVLKSDWIMLQDGFDLTGLSNDPNQAWLDADTVVPPLSVHARRDGDRFSPLGMQGHSMKLADFFINAHLPRRVRNTWPLVYSKGQIAWVPGFRPGENFKVTNTTRSCLHLTLEKSSSFI
jgi:tRNA(Ile)-lysidine synthase